MKHLNELLLSQLWLKQLTVFSIAPYRRDNWNDAEEEVFNNEYAVDVVISEPPETSEAIVKEAGH